MNLSEFEDAYEDEQRIRGALLTTALKQLDLRDWVQVDASATVVDAVNAMNDRHRGVVLVMKQGRLAGIFTERDVLTKVAFHPEARSKNVQSAMTPDPETLGPEDSVAVALNRMSVGGYRHIPIVDGEGRPQGVVGVRDIVDFIVELFPESVLNQPPSPDKAIPKTVDGG